MIRILMAEDQGMVRGAISTLLSLEDDLDVVAEVARADEVVAAAVAAQPDVARLDIEMPGGDGITAAAALTATLPSCRVIILTTFGRPGYLRRAMLAGAVGFLLKDAPVATLASAIRRCRAGERVIDPSLAAAAITEGASPLTEREQEVLVAARQGSTVADIAASVHLSQGTVRNHLSAIIAKLGARNRAEAVRIAEEKGWL